MAYSTPALVRKALVPTSDGSRPVEPTHTAADLTDEQLVDAVAEADATIDGYIGKFYATPVAQVGDPLATPVPIGMWSRVIAAYLASCTYRGSMDFSDNDPVARRYNSVVATLKDVSAGRVTLSLPGASGSGATGEGSVGPAVNPYIGDLFTPSDFSLQPGPDNGYPEVPYWRSPWDL